MELREKIAALVSPREWTDGREASDLYAADRKRSLAKADAILAIPEIRDAQERIAKLEREIEAMDGDARECGYFN